MGRNQKTYRGVFYLMSILRILEESEVTNCTEITENKLIHGNCLNILSYIPDKSIDCIICDLPYG